MSEPCEHFAEAVDIPPRNKGCESCMALGAPWTELRVCQSCGHVGCCEDSTHAHALEHFRATGHAVIMPLDRRETWAWCYVHSRYLHDVRETAPAGVGGRLVRLLRRWTGA